MSVYSREKGSKTRIRCVSQVEKDPDLKIYPETCARDTAWETVRSQGLRARKAWV